MKKTLWTHDFSIITIGTLVSAIGGTAMNFAFALVVFDETSSTLLTGIFSAVSFLPTFLIPIFAAPYIDRANRKRCIAGIDLFNGISYLLFAGFLSIYGFSYVGYMGISLIVGSTGAVYSLAYQALYPDLIPEGFAQKGYSVSSMIYPSVTALFTPIASLLYVNYGVISICVLEAGMLIAASLFEMRIQYQEDVMRKGEGFSFVQYKLDLREGLQYLKKEKGIRSIYSYMATTNATSTAVSMMSMATFQSSSMLTTTMYAFLTTADTAGRIVGGFVHYFIKIPYQKRYQIAVTVYAIYNVLDCSLLFIAYPLMIINRFIGGFLGINSLNIREASTQNYIPSHMRARVNSLFNVLISMCIMIVQLSAGILGEYVSYRIIALGFSLIAMAAVGFLIVKNRKAVEAIYNQNI